MDKKAFIFFGKSGAGKGTQVSKLIEYLETHDPDRRVISVESGKGIRALGERNCYIGHLVQKKLETGGLLPEFLPIWVWTDFLINNYTGEESIVFDGVSRRLNEAPVIDGALDFINAEHRYIVHINTSDEWSTQRLLERGRGDDHEEEIKARLAWYEENVAPVVETFRKNDKYAFLDINGEQPIEKVHRDIVEAIS